MVMVMDPFLIMVILQGQAHGNGPGTGYGHKNATERDSYGMPT